MILARCYVAIFRESNNYIGVQLQMKVKTDFLAIKHSL